jgi:hypothetical protein
MIARARPFLLLLVALSLAAAPMARAAGKVEELSKILLEDSSYKVRLQAALLLGRLGDRGGAEALIKALGDDHKMVRGMAAQSLGKLGVPEAAAPLKALLGREKDSFVRTQAQKALAALGTASAPAGAAQAKNARAKVYLTFGSFSGGTRLADAALLEMLRTVLRRELGKLATVTFTLEPDEERTFARSGRLGFLIDGNVTRLEDARTGGSVEVNCDVKVMVARWPSKSIIMWTNAGATVQAGSRERDILGARRDCLEASASQVGEDLAKFFQAQGG